MSAAAISPRRMARAGWDLLALLLLAVAALVGWMLLSDYRQESVRAERELDAMASVVETNIVAEIQATASVLHHLASMLSAESGDRTMLAHQFEHMDTLSEAQVGIRTLLILDAEGAVIASSRHELLGRNFAERAYFRSARDLGADRLHLSTPFRTVLGVWGMNLVLPLRSARGEFLGTVSATLDGQYFQTLLESVRYLPDVAASITHGGGLQFSLVPERSGAEGQHLDMAESLFSRHLASGRQASLLSGLSYSTGQERMMALRTIRPSSVELDNGLVVSVSRELQAIYAPWRERALNTLALLLMFVVAAVAGNAMFQRRKLRDAAKLEQALGDLERRDKQFRAASDNARDAFVIIGGERGIVVWWNAAAERLFGYGAEEIVGHPLHDLVTPPELRAAAQRGLAQFAQSGTGVAIGHMLELTALRKNGETFPIELSLAGMQLDGTWYGVGLARDITARKQAEAEMQRKDHLLMQQARLAAMGEMIGNIAHQWRQPLNILGLVVQNLRYDFHEGRLATAELDAYVDKAMKAIGQMSATIDDFRDFFRPNRQAEDFSPRACIADCARLLEAGLQANRIELAVHGATETALHGYPGEFSRAILNILTNAKEALAAGPALPDRRIDIDLADSGDAVVVTIDDNAGGIAAEYMEKVFDPYFTTKEKGTGIGLYMTRIIVEQHLHGTIQVENTAVGARFTLRLPREAVAAPVPEGGQPSAGGGAE
jgi:PAS domain S-box-containing protein